MFTPLKIKTEGVNLLTNWVSLLIPKVTSMAHTVCVKIQALPYIKLEGLFSFCFGPTDSITINRQSSLQPHLCLLTK